MYGESFLKATCPFSCIPEAWAYDLKPIWGGTKFLPEKFVTVIVSPKKKKKKKKKVIARFAAPDLLLLD